LAIRNAAGVEIDRQFVVALRGLLKKRFDLLFAELDRQHAVLETVVVKNVRKAGGDDDAEPVILDRPERMLAAGPTAEIASGEENCRAGGNRSIQFKLGI